jgi:hypothetical protein
LAEIRKNSDRKGLAMNQAPNSKSWLELFHAARLETDKKKRLDCIEAAEKAIHERLRELAQESNNSMEERWLIDVALMNLRSLLEDPAAA